MRTMIAVLVMTVATTTIAQQTNTLDSLRHACEMKQRSILVQYGRNLDAIMADVKKQGDLDSLLILRAEQKRFGVEKTVPDTKDSKGPFGPAVEVYYQAMVALLGQYAANLDTLIKKEVVSDRIEEAKMVKAEKDKIVFILADMQTQLPAKGTVAMQKAPVKEEPPQVAPWVSGAPPPLAPGGWLTLFDGAKLYACNVPPEFITSRKVKVENGALRIDDMPSGVTFNLSGRDVMIRAQVKNISARTLNLRVRQHDDGSFYGSGFIGGSDSFVIGKCVQGKWADIAAGRSPRRYDGFIDLELSAIGNTLTLKAEGRTVVQAVDRAIGDGRFCVGSWRGVSLFRRIEAKVLDKEQ